MEQNLLIAFGITKVPESNIDVGLTPDNLIVARGRAIVLMDSIIKLEDVSTVYEGERRPAIRDVNLTLERNELVYVIGPNAAGKTTLLETVNGLLPVFRGKLSVLGLDVQTRGRTVRCQIGYVPQDFMVEPGEPYKALDVVLMGCYGRIGTLHRPEETDREKAVKAMQLLGVEELADRPMGKLSGGQQQKVMLARAIAKEPKILLLDEPFSNLDPESKDKIPSLMRQLHEETELTIIIVTHDVSSMLKQCHRAIVMVNGRILVDESPEKALATLNKSAAFSPEAFR
jgi:zinc/manganese transport system ATP-binding protein